MKIFNNILSVLIFVLSTIKSNCLKTLNNKNIRFFSEFTNSVNIHDDYCDVYKYEDEYNSYSGSCKNCENCDEISDSLCDVSVYLKGNDESVIDFNNLKNNILYSHEIYDNVKNERDIAIFMESHVWAVFDFMTLLKRLQREFTNVGSIWTPRCSSDIARFIGEICISEESDELPEYLIRELNQNHISHYELYKMAMKEVGANYSNIEEFVRLLNEGSATVDDLYRLAPSEAVANFVFNNIEISNFGSKLEVASTFFFGREEPIPQMFIKIRDSSPNSENLKYFNYYLERHIEVDGDDHGPKAMKVLDYLINCNKENMDNAIEYGIEAVMARIALWDDVNNRIKNNN